MSDESDSNELLREGLKSYPEARIALLQFESLIQPTAREVLMKLGPALEDVTGRTNLKAPAVWPSIWNSDFSQQMFLLGAGVEVTREWGFMCGVGWLEEKQNTEHLSPFTSAGFRCWAQKRQNNMLKKLEETVKVRLGRFTLRHTTYSNSYEIGLSSSIGKEATVERISESLSDVSAAIIDMLKEMKGGLNAVLV